MNKSYHDLVAEAKTRIAEITVAETRAIHDRGDAMTLIDIRDPNETSLGMIPGAVQLSRGNLEKFIEGVAPRDARIVLYCSSGSRSALAADSLRQMGYTNVASMAGGIQEWVSAGGDID